MRKSEIGESRKKLQQQQSVKNRHLEYADILTVLAEGFNPITGEEFGEMVLDQKEIIYALTAGAAALRHVAESVSLSENSGKKHKNAGKPWTSEEEVILLEAFDNGEPIDMIAIDLGRTKRAIACRLDKLMIKPSDYRKRQALRKFKIIPDKNKSSD